MADEEKTETPQEPVQEQGFNLNEWKGVYQNNKSKPAVAFEWLWKNYEPENWCVSLQISTAPRDRELTDLPPPSSHSFFVAIPIQFYQIQLVFTDGNGKLLFRSGGIIYHGGLPFFQSVC